MSHEEHASGANGWPLRVGLARDGIRLAAWLGVRGAIGVVGLIVGLQTPGMIGTAVTIVGTGVLLYVLGLAIHVITVRIELYPDELHVVSSLIRRRYRLARGAITRMQVGARRGSFGTQLGGFGVEVGLGRASGGEAVDVVRLAPRSSVIMVPCEGPRLAIAPSSEESLIDALESATGGRVT